MKHDRVMLGALPYAQNFFLNRYFITKALNIIKIQAASLTQVR